MNPVEFLNGNLLFEKYANWKTFLLSTQVVLTVGSHSTFTFLQMLKGRTAETIFPASWITSITHSKILYAFFVPRTATRYMMKEDRAIVVLKVTMGICMAMYLRTSEVSWVKGSPKGLPKPWWTESVRKTVDTIAEIWRQTKDVSNGVCGTNG